MPVNVLDASGNSVPIPTPNNNGQATSANSKPVVIASDQSGVPTIPANITTKFREAFEVLDLAKWSVTTAAGDIIQVDGNTAAASYLVISKSPYCGHGKCHRDAGHLLNAYRIGIWRAYVAADVGPGVLC